jgi:hypothetical protein
MQRPRNDVRRPEADLTARRVTALRRIRRGASAAYVQGAMAAVVAATMASAGDRVGGLRVLTAGAIVIALGAWLSRRKAAAPAALLGAVVLVFAAWLWSGGVHVATVLLVAGLAWQFSDAYRAARTLAALEEASKPLTAAT